jgi:hypothetical protein
MSYEQQAGERTGHGSEGLAEAESHCSRVPRRTTSQIFGWIGNLIND